MGRGKGPDGKTIKEAVSETIAKLQRATGKMIFKEVKNIHDWGDHEIWRHIMGMTINLQPGYYEWNFIKPSDKVLFLLTDGYFERYDQKKHGIFKDGIKAG